MKSYKKKTGFTLVEVLIVITIVGLLATTSIGGYTRFRKSSMIDLAAKSIVASLYDARDNAKFGKVVGGASGVSVSYDENTDEEIADDGRDSEDERGASCFGLKFVGVAGSDSDAGVFNVVSEFDSGREWKATKWIYKGCGAVNNPAIASGSFSAEVNLAEGVKIEKINDNTSGSCVVLFAPPNGEVDGSQCGDADKIVSVVVGYGDDDQDFKRQININLKNGVAEIKKITDENAD